MSDNIYTYAHDGYSKSYRKKWFNPVFRNLLEAGIWAWMCDTAAWKETKVRFNGELVTLQRGQMVTSIRFISQGFNIGEQPTRTFLENLKNDGMVNTQTNKRGTIITICNYDKYQSLETTTNLQDNTQPTHSQHTANTKKEEHKNIRSIFNGQISEDEIVTEPAQQEDKINKVKKSPRKSTRLESDWELPTEWGLWAEHEERLTRDDVIREADKFKDYWISAPGSKALKANWEATWRNWIRNKKERFTK